MSLDQASWLHHAQALPLGKSHKVAHDCGDTSMIVSHKDTGWSAHCFRCHDRGWVPKPPPTMLERLAQREAQRCADAAIERDPRPPYPADFDVPSWPPQARAWLYKAGLFIEDIKRLGAYYHARTGRVVLPIVEAGKVVFWQARCVDGSGPKYLSSSVPKGSIVPRWGKADQIVLTEDILSAFRVGMEGEAWSLMGTELATSVLARLLKEGKPVLIWLDPDDAGQNAAADVSRTLASVGVPHKNIITKCDPKLLSRAQIREVLWRSASTS